MDLPFLNTMLFFKNEEIPFDPSIENYSELFDNVFKFYSRMLRESIKKTGISNSSHLLFYTYLICDAKELSSILEDFNNLSVERKMPTNAHFLKFKEKVDYAGKGRDIRMFSHLINSKKIQMKILNPSKICARYSKICNLWDNGHGVMIIRMFGEFSNEEALSCEYALIKALGLNNLTNEISGTCYGAMKDTWTENEIINFGNILLMNTLKSISVDNPEIIMDYNVNVNVIVNNDDEDDNLSKWEIDGMLKCLVDM